MLWYKENKLISWDIRLGHHFALIRLHLHHLKFVQPPVLSS